MIIKWFKALLGDRAAQQPDAEPPAPAADVPPAPSRPPVEPPAPSRPPVEPPAPSRPPVEPPAAEASSAPAPGAPQDPEDALQRMLLRAAADEAVRWFVEEVLPNLF
ncbi:hypothetical protein ACIQNV_39165 [Streptomyces hydrogenans]|uniref:hypothetical protein n=1 Tax=Streptomyces hydrogenans TaxID=1873719 RepID=UPI00382AB88C